MFQFFQKDNPPQSEVETGILQVTVLHPFGKPLASVEVGVWQNSRLVLLGKTDVLGRWQASLPPGTYLVAALRNQALRQEVEVKIGGRTEVSLVWQEQLAARNLKKSLAAEPESFRLCSASNEMGGSGVNLKFSARQPASMLMMRKLSASFPPPESWQASFQNAPENTEDYGRTEENTFLDPTDNPVSTFSVDVDTASYANVRRMLKEGRMPPADAVRLEEFLNYFDYDYPAPVGEHPLEITAELGECPWAAERHLLLVGLQGRRLETAQLPPSHLVLLLDVSGSMDQRNKLPWLQQSMRLFAGQLRPSDRVSVVTYAGSVQVALPPTSGAEKEKILAVVDSLRAAGGTSGGPALQAAYRVAREHFVFGGNNRILLCTDGDFNIGPSTDSELVSLVEREREGGVYLSILGFGMGNYKDHKLLQVAGKGNGNFHYVDTPLEARKVLVEEFAGTMFTIADNVKIQVEFNPARVAGYRLLGYEKRLLRREDFNDDKKDAAEVGAGHRVTALYEIAPAGKPVPGALPPDALKYQQAQPSPAAASEEWLTLKLRYILPQSGEKSRLLEKVVAGEPLPLAATSGNFRLASAAASFAMLLRDSPHKGSLTWELARQLAGGALGNDPQDYRKELCVLLRNAEMLAECKSLPA